jgi:hypothetical protein
MLVKWRRGPLPPTPRSSRVAEDQKTTAISGMKYSLSCLSPQPQGETAMPTEKNLQELFHETLKDIYFAEKKILAALPKMAKAAQS